MMAPLLARLGSHDRALSPLRDVAGGTACASQQDWRSYPCGGTGPSLAAGPPLLACCELSTGPELALPTVVMSHLLVQLVKRTVGRGRPAARAGVLAG